MPPILPPDNGFLFLDREQFHGSFAGDLPAAQVAGSHAIYGSNPEAIARLIRQAAAGTQ